MALVKAMGIDFFPTTNEEDEIVQVNGMAGTVNANVVYESAFDTTTSLGTDNYLRMNGNQIYLPFNRPLVTNPTAGQFVYYEYTVTGFIPVGTVLNNGDGITQLAGLEADGQWSVSVIYDNGQIVINNHLSQVITTTNILEAGKPYTFTIRTKSEQEGPPGAENGEIEIWLNGVQIYALTGVNWVDDDQLSAAAMRANFGGPGFDILWRDAVVWDAWTTGAGINPVFHRVETLDNTGSAVTITGTAEDELEAVPTDVDSMADFDDNTFIKLTGDTSSIQAELANASGVSPATASAVQTYLRARKDNTETTSVTVDVINSTNSASLGSDTISLASDTTPADAVRQFDLSHPNNQIWVKYTAVAG